MIFSGEKEARFYNRQAREKEKGSIKIIREFDFANIVIRSA